MRVRNGKQSLSVKTTGLTPGQKLVTTGGQAADLCDAGNVGRTMALAGENRRKNEVQDTGDGQRCRKVGSCCGRGVRREQLQVYLRLGVKQPERVARGIRSRQASTLT